MTEQVEMFHESLEDALDAIVTATGGYKRVGDELWPDKGPEGAGRHLRHCLTADRERDKLSLSQVFWLLKRGHEHGIHTAMYWLADEIGYSRPEPVTPDDQQDELRRQFCSKFDEMAALLKRFERIQGSVRAVK